jgi:hypothetical protein
MKAAGAIASAWRTLRRYPGYFFMRSVARIDSVRNAVAGLQTLMRSSLSDYLQTLASERSQFFADADPAVIAERLDRDGFAFGLTLPKEKVATIVDFARSNPCFVDRDPALGFLPAQIEQVREKLGRKFLLAQYFNLRSRLPVVAQLSRDPVLLGIAARYLRTPPTLVGVNLFWSYPAALSADRHSYAAQMFHYDLDDFRFMKFFFYLSDVDSAAGPHVAVRATHRYKHYFGVGDRFKVRRYSDAEIVAAYGKERVVSITGPAGMGFAEDTLCIHKGQTPTTRERLILQFQYALNDWGIQHDDRDESELAMI